VVRWSYFCIYRIKHVTVFEIKIEKRLILSKKFKKGKKSGFYGLTH